MNLRMDSLLGATWRAFNEDKAPRLAAALAFSTILSIAPLCIVIIAVAGWFLGTQNGGHGHHVVEDALLSRLRDSAGAGVADSVRDIIGASFNKPRQGQISQVVGWVGFAVGATALFSSLQDALNAVWHVEAVHGSWKRTVRDRLVSFGMILLVGLFLLATLLANAGTAFVARYFASLIPLPANPVLLTIAAELASLLLITFAFALIYKVLPDVDIAWRDVWPGAAATAVLFVVGEVAISLYLSLAGVASAYGAAGSLLVALLWSYYTAMVVLLGAEFTKVRAGHAQTTAPTDVRQISKQPAGVDPRFAGHERL
ncbi:MAG: YihY/virulence factor BrkB family protein [Vulcanimicrobiaceae bacterium]